MANQADILLKVRSDASGAQAVAAAVERVRQAAAGATRESASAATVAARQARAQADIERAASRTAQAQAQAATATERYAQAQARTARESLARASAEQRLARDIAQTAAAQDRAATAALRRQQAEERARRAAENGGTGPALPRTFAGFSGVGGALSLAGGIAGGIGIAEVARGAISGGVDAGRNALELQRTLSLTRELSGTQATYNRVIEAAREQQRLYGGSLRDNIAGIQGLVITARSSGAELDQLINLAQRLALLDPAQGPEGARIALSEALSGDPRSLALRYEIPKTALQELTDTGKTAAERLLVLDKYLSQIGITGAAVSKTISEQALAYNRVNAELDTLKTNVGAGLANAFTPAATGLSRLIGVINDNPQAIAEIKALLSGQPVTQEGIQQAARDVAEKQIRSGLDTGGEIAVRVATRGDLGNDQALRQAQERFGALREQAITLAATNDEVAASVRRAADEFGKTGDLEAFGTRLGLIRAALDAVNAPTGEPAYLQYLRAGPPAAEQLAASVRALSAEQQKNLADTAAAQVEALRLKDAQAALAADSALAARGLLGDGDQALLLAQRYGIAQDAAQGLINAQQALTNRAALSDQRAGERSGGAVRSTQEANLLANAGRAAAERARQAEEARRQQILATGTAAQRVAVLQQEYNKAVKDFGANSAEAINAQTRLRQAQQGGRSGGGSRGVSADTRADLNATNDLITQRDILQKRLDTLKAGTNEYKNVLGQILDLDEKIASAKEKQVRAAIDSRIAAIEDRKTRRQEDQRIAQAQRILASGSASNEQRAAARDVLELIPLERQRRELDLQRTQREAANTTVNITDGAVQVLIDGRAIDSRIITNLRGAVAQARSQG